MNIAKLLTLFAAVVGIGAAPSAELVYPACTSCRLYIPNAFSPNNDGVNDEFKPSPSATCTSEKYQLNVYDRNGSLVFQSIELDKAWDGKFRNEPAPSATYYYIVQYTYSTEDNGTTTEIANGDLNLLR